MTTGISVTVREEMLKWLANITGATQPDDVYYLQWHTEDPGVAGTTSISLLLTTRDVIAGATPFWVVGSGGVDGIVENKEAGESAVAGAGTPEEIDFFSVWKHVTNAATTDFVFSGTVTGAPSLAVGGKLTYSAGDLTVTLTGAA